LTFTTKGKRNQGEFAQSLGMQSPFEEPFLS